MKKYILIIVLSFFQLTILFSQQNNKGGYKSCIVYEYNYKFGEIDTISKKEQYRVKYDDNGNTIERSTELYGKNTSKYDDKGNLIEEIEYKSDGIIESKSTRKYNERGYLIETVSYNADGSIKNKTTYNYDEKGNEIEQVEYNANGAVKTKIITKYNDNNNKIKSVIYDENGSITRSDSSIYNLKGKIVEKRSYMNYMEVQNSKWFVKYIYDNNDNLIQEINYQNNGKVDKKTICKYTENGKISEVISFNKKGLVSFKSTIKYDSIGNKVEVKSGQYYDNGQIDKMVVEKYNKSGITIEVEKASYKYEGTLRNRTVTKHDEYGNMKESIEYNKLNEPIKKTEYIYSK